MALDRAILAAHEAESVPPTLRIYSWSSPTVSLGRFQGAGDVDLGLCSARGVGICRRPTGGRGVLHDDEVTYSIVAGVRDGLPRGVSASYRKLCSALVDAYQAMGIDAGLTSRSRGEPGAGDCYLHATTADLSMGAAKLSGSAQVWSKESCLQHGSIVMSRDLDLEAAVFRLGSSGRQALGRSTGTVGEILGRRPSDDAVMTALVRGVERALQVDVEAGEYAPSEISAATLFEEEFRVTAADR